MGILEKALSSLEQGMKVVYITIIEQQGSTPRKDHARMLVLQDKSTVETIGGGKLEAEALAKAYECLCHEKPVTMYRELSSEDAADSDMICGGNILLYICSLLPTQKHIQLFKELIQGIQEGETLFLNCPLEEGLPFFLSKEKKADSAYYCDTFIPPARIILLGAGHVAKATAFLGDFIGYSTLVLDDREEFLQENRFPASTLRRLCNMEHCFSHTQVFPSDSLVIVTRGHVHDIHALRAALSTPAKYIGMIGSKRKKAMVYQILLKEGFSQEQLNEVHSPIGLPLNANTPEEIAVAIIAEILGFKSENKL